MEILEIIGYLGAIGIGVTLGMIGGGGSVLTVPVFVYFLQVEPVLATAYSLFVVGITASAGAIRNVRENMVDLRTGIVFAIPSILAVYLTRRYVLPAIPATLYSADWIIISKSMFIMALFAIMMIITSVFMIKDSNEIQAKNSTQSFNFVLIFLEGAGVGFLTGLVGAGGGFLIIPALVLLAKLPMKLAVGTSLFIIALKSLIGFLGDIGAQQEINWLTLGVFSILAIAGIFMGSHFSGSINNKVLKKSFGWFVLIMGTTILIIEIV